jgi:hypothetical protein
MKRFPILGFLLLVPALALFAVVGCNPDKGKKNEDGKAGGDAAKDDKEKKKTSVEIETPRDATVKGVVKLKGKAPEVKIDPRIAKHDTDAKFCMSAPEKYKIEQLWMVGKDNEVANVVVFLAPPAGKKFKIDEELIERSKKTVEIDQPFCNYDPHVVALWPGTAKTDVQGLVFLNEAPVPHNVKVNGGSKIGNPDINMKPKPNDGKATRSEVLFLKGGGDTIIDASCSMHTWMNCKIALFTHPYCAVTKADGTFEIPNVPIDEELTVYVWHESFGANLDKKMEAPKHKMTKGVNELKTIEIK